ncbi:MAG: hypothetical protein AAGC60_24655 [Acidobacteriota bacterium]
MRQHTPHLLTDPATDEVAGANRLASTGSLQSLQHAAWIAPAVLVGLGLAVGSSSLVVLALGLAAGASLAGSI